MTNENLHNSKYFENMNKFHFAMSKKIKKIMCDGLQPGLDMPHIQLLEIIENRGQCMVSDIAYHCHITLSGVTNLVNKLVHMNLVTRERSEDDRRIVLIRLTDEGRTELHRINENRKKIFNEMFSALTEGEIKDFFHTMDKIIIHFLEQEDDRGNEGITKSS